VIGYFEINRIYSFSIEVYYNDSYSNQYNKKTVLMISLVIINILYDLLNAFVYICSSKAAKRAESAVYDAYKDHNEILIIWQHYHLLRIGTA
jgi:hypothetical protein